MLADILISVMNIYFQFQFVTNLAAIAEKYQTEEDDLHGKMLKYRTWQTVILTVITIETELLCLRSLRWWDIFYDHGSGLFDSGILSDQGAV